MARGALYGPYWWVRIDITQLDIFKTIPVARILVHNFEELKAMDNGRGKRLVMLKTPRTAQSWWWYLKNKFGKSLGTFEGLTTSTKTSRGDQYGSLWTGVLGHLRPSGCRHHYGKGKRSVLRTTFVMASRNGDPWALLKRLAPRSLARTVLLKTARSGNRFAPWQMTAKFWNLGFMTLAWISRYGVLHVWSSKSFLCILMI